MIARLIHKARVWHARRREAAKEARSPHWGAVRNAWLHTHPACAACGGADEPQVHHVMPFAVDPRLELDPGNLITLCMGAHECHLKIGHGGDFEYYNPDVRIDAELAMRRPSIRDAICDRARTKRERE